MPATANSTVAVSSGCGVVRPRALRVRGPNGAIVQPARVVSAEQPEPVKLGETRSYEGFCVSLSSMLGSLIHDTVGSFEGSGLRWRNLVA